MRNLATLVLIFTLNTLAQQPKVQPPSSPEPGVEVRQEFLRAYNAKDVEAVVALYSEDATLVSDGGTFRGKDEIRNWVKSGLDQGSRLESSQSLERVLALSPTRRVEREGLLAPSSISGSI